MKKIKTMKINSVIGHLGKQGSQNKVKEQDSLVPYFSEELEAQTGLVFWLCNKLPY